MIELLAVMCTLNGACRDVAITYAAESVTVLQCMVQSQAELAKWATEHPGYQVKRWKCGPAGRYAKI